MVKQREGYRIVILEPARTWINESKCGGCGKPKNEWNRRKDWTCCSSECTEKYMANSYMLGWNDFRAKALKRDGNRCVKCGKEGVNRTRIYGLPEKEYYLRSPRLKRIEKVNGVEYAIMKSSRNLIIDHIVPIALGGHEWNMDNLQTLCVDCNRIKTAQDIKEIARLRRKEKLAKEFRRTGQKVLVQ